MAKGAPQGIRHGKARHSFELIEWLRDLHEYEGIPDRTLFELFPCISRHTMHEWLYYRTRATA